MHAALPLGPLSSGDAMISEFPAVGKEFPPCGIYGEPGEEVTAQAPRSEEHCQTVCSGEGCTFGETIPGLLLVPATVREPDYRTSSAAYPS